MTIPSFFNTETRKKEPIQSTPGKPLLVYTCGPTVYDFAHIGNFRTYIFEDLFLKTLRYFGSEIFQVMNITDVDDKTIKGAIKKGVTLAEYVEPFKKAFFEDLKTLNIEPAKEYPSATDFIPQMIEMIEQLIKKGVAYKAQDGSVYFSIGKFQRYGCLSHLNLDELQSGASERTASDEYEKDHISDFVLWKGYDATRDGDIFWESPFGKGRPGWHLECSAMATHFLGESIDIHMGGVDNIFPHHENEIAQSEACSGKKFAKHWLHSEHLIVEGRKMSKSFGNFYTIRDLLKKGFTGQEIRYMLLHTHYRSQLNFTMEELEAVRHSLVRLSDFIRRLQTVDGKQESDEYKAVLNKAKKHFETALADDLNISSALAALFDLIREVHSLIDAEKVGEEGAKEVLDLLKSFNQVLGVMEFEKEETIPPKIQEIYDKRLQARADKNWALADELRDEIAKLGWVIEDSPKGSFLKKSL